MKYDAINCQQSQFEFKSIYIFCILFYDAGMPVKAVATVKETKGESLTDGKLSTYYISQTVDHPWATIDLLTPHVIEAVWFYSIDTGGSKLAH